VGECIGFNSKNMNRNYKQKDRDDSKDFIYGIRTILEALDANKTVNKVLIQQGLTGNLWNTLKTALEPRDIKPQMVPIQKLNKLTNQNHQGAIAYLSPINYYSLEEVVEIEKGDKEPFFMILDRITDVRNLGAIARTAEVNGVDGIIIPSAGSAKVNADAIKTSAGALHKIKVARVEHLKDAIYYMQANGIKVVGCTEKTSNDLPVTDLKGSIAIVMGSEENGISPNLMKACDDLVKIPMYGSISSLNVSVAAGTVMYEVNRQRNF